MEAVQLENESLISINKIITDEEIESVWEYADFGINRNQNKRQLIEQAVLKCASGYYQGHTSETIITELGLIDNKYKLTGKGRAFLYESFKNENFSVWKKVNSYG